MKTRFFYWGAAWLFRPPGARTWRCPPGGVGLAGLAPAWRSVYFRRARGPRAGPPRSCPGPRPRVTVTSFFFLEVNANFVCQDRWLPSTLTQGRGEVYLSRQRELLRFCKTRFASRVLMTRRSEKMAPSCTSMVCGWADFRPRGRFIPDAAAQLRERRASCGVSIRSPRHRGERGGGEEVQHDAQITPAT